MIVAARRAGRLARGVAALVLGATAALRADAAPPPVSIEDLEQLRFVEAIDVSENGRLAVVAVRSIGRTAPDAPLENRAHLHLVDLARETPAWRQLTFGARRDRAPRLSPDGRRLAFLRGENGAAQVWVMATDGGEAQPVTALPRGVDAFAWMPDGRSVVVRTPTLADELGPLPWASERPGDAPVDAEPALAGPPPTLRAWIDAGGADGDPLVIDRLAFQDETSLRGPLELRQLHRVDLGADVPGIAPIASIAPAPRDHGDFAPTPDGRAIVYSAVADETRHPDRVRERCLRRIDLATGTDEIVLRLEGWSLDAPRPSRDGAILAFIGRRTDWPAHRPRQLGASELGPAGCGEPLWLTSEEGLDASVRQVQWNAQPAGLLFTTALSGGFPLMTMGLGLLEPAALVQSIDNETAGVHAFGAGGGAIVYAATTPSAPCVVRVRDARGDRVVADLNPWVRERRLALPQRRSIARPDGQRVEAWIVPPVERDAASRHPLILAIHGGPAAMWGPGEPSMWHEFQVLAGRGFGVVYANPRGSDGYGTAFRRANYRDWGEGPTGDVLAALDAATAEPWVDPKRLYVAGGSYGGYLTAYVLTRDARFRAAVAQRGVYDLATFFGEGNAWRLVEDSFGGRPWDGEVRDLLRRQSPFWNVARIRTPLLLMHADRDLRTGVSQSEMLYRALKELERPVEYVRYPAEGHELSRSGDPARRMDRLARIVEWFERWD